MLDNASYHSKQLNRAPTTNSKKADIQQWLQERNIDYNDDMLKAQLLFLIKQNKGEIKRAVDEMVKEVNKTVVILPTYHCDLLQEIIKILS